jgi:drug/metabolite transporter (DMT)-like permease
MSQTVSSRHALLLVAATACWGCGTVLSKQVLDRGVAPLTLLVIELAASSALLSLGALVVQGRVRRSATLGRLALLGILNPGLAYALGLLGLTTISASLSVLLWATEPVLIIVLAALVLRERIAGATMVGVAIALVGVVLVVYSPGASGDLTGVAFTVTAVSACALYTVLTRWLVLDHSSLDVVLAQQVAALAFAVVLVVAARAVGNHSGPALPSDTSTWALAAASGALYYGLAFWFFIGGLRGVPASIAGSLLPLIPVFGLTAGYLLGERLVDRQWLGAALVITATAGAAARHLTRRAA